jgi:RHS repeat-associated protein
LACLERRSYGEPALLKSGVEPSEGGQMPGKKYLTNANTTKEGFTGKEFDVESELTYFAARYYDPTIGRFPAVDPHANRYLAWTTYNYAFNNPIRFIDPTGMDGEDSKELKKDELVEKVNKAKESGQDVLTTVTNEIASNENVTVSGETIESTLTETGAELDGSQLDLIKNIDKVSKTGDKLEISNKSEIEFKVGGNTLELSKNITANISAGKSGVTISNIQGLSVEYGFLNIDIEKIEFTKASIKVETALKNVEIPIK